MIDKFPQTLTYWKKDGLDQVNQPIWDGPYVTKCRWEEKQRLYITETGREVRGNSTVYLPEDLITQGDYVYKGESTKSSPDSKSFEVKRNNSISNLRGTKMQYSYIL